MKELTLCVEATVARYLSWQLKMIRYQYRSPEQNEGQGFGVVSGERFNLGVRMNFQASGSQVKRKDHAVPLHPDSLLSGGERWAPLGGSLHFF